jgi:hypothetical protein
LRIYNLKKMSIPKIAVLATGLTAAILVGTLSPQAAQAFPVYQANCTNCHGVGAAPGFMQINFLGPTTMAPGTEYALQLNMDANVNDGQGGWWIANSDESGATGAAATVCRDAWGVTPPIAPACYGGPALSQSFTARLTAPASAGTYYYKVFMVHGKPAAQETYTKTFSITVTAPVTTAPPTTVPVVTTTTPEPVVTTTLPVVTTTTPVPVVTTTEPVVTTTTPDPEVTTTEPVVTTTTPDPEVTTTTPDPEVTTTEPVVITTEPTDTTTTTAPVVTTTEPTDTTTTTAPVAVAGVSAVIPVGAPNTGAGGSSTTDGPLAGLGGLALLLAGAGATTVIRRRRQA